MVIEELRSSSFFLLVFVVFTEKNTIFVYKPEGSEVEVTMSKTTSTTAPGANTSNPEYGRDKVEKRARNWMITLNNPSMDEDAFAKIYREHKHFRYLVFQREKSESGTVHYQGYVEFSVSLRFNAVKLLCPSAHIGPRIKTPDNCRDYCMKEDTRIAGPWEYGTFKGCQGKRNDLDSVVETMKEAKTFREVVVAHPTQNIKYLKGIRTVFAYLKSGETERTPPRVTLLYGSTGTGKTKKIMSMTDVFKKSGTDQWFDGYMDQNVMLIDDFAGARSKMGLSHLLQILDRYPVKVPVKGDFVDLVAKEIYVTTNIHPRMWYDYSKREEHYKALKRRFHAVEWFWMEGKSMMLDLDSFWDDWAETCDETRIFQELDEPNVAASDDEVVQATQVLSSFEESDSESQ